VFPPHERNDIVRRNIARCALFAAVLIGPGGLPRAGAEDLKPTDSDRLVTRKVLELLQQKHLLKKDFDRRMAGQALDHFLATIDPDKLYFLQTDVAEFNRRKPELAEELKEGDVAIAFDVYRRYQQRVAEAAEVRKEFLGPDARHDFTAKEVVVTDPKAREYPKDAKVFREQWRLWVKYGLLEMKTDPETKGADLAKLCEELSARYERNERGVRQAKNHQVLEGFLYCVGARYDNDATYRSQASLEEFQELMRGNFVGIGVNIQDHNRVAALVPGSPAVASGFLKPNDRIVAVGQGDFGAMTDIRRLTMKEYIALIRGAEGTTVRLEITRPGEEKHRTVTLRRARVRDTASQIEARLMTAGTTKVGYLDVPNFYRDDQTGDSTIAEVRRQLERFATQSADVVVLDLRRCNGGYLDQGVGLAGLFVGKGPIIQSKNQAGEAATQANQTTDMAWTKPLVVLVGRGTGSGAEFVCAAIQDAKRGLVVGDDTTAGAGLIRTPTDVGDKLGSLMVTTNQFFRVTGEGIQQRGVTPDVTVPSPASVRPRAAEESGSNFGFDRLKPLDVPSQNLVSTEAVLALRAHSRERRRASTEFKALQALTEWEHGKTARTVETLNEAEYQAQRKDAPTDELPKPKSGEADFHLQEVNLIAAEYAKGLNGRTASPPMIAPPPPPLVDPDIARRQERANQREYARQDMQRLDEVIRITNNKILLAQLTQIAAKKAYDDAEPGSAKEVVASIAFFAAQRALADLKSELGRAESDLGAARSRYNSLRD
jgi:carboxyl-terminal processing protease